MFETLSERLTQVFSSLRGKGRLSAADIDATAREIRIALLEADVALPVVRAFIARVKERASSEEVSGALNPAQQVIKIVHEELIDILGGETHRLRFAKVPPTIIMLAGLQGSGKTTLAGKLALWLREQGNTPMLVAADLQRPNAVQQLQVLGERAGVPVYAPEPGNGVGDPIAVARQSVPEAQRRQQNMIIIDTAGRLGIDEELMRQAVGIRDAVQPDEILFVVDAMIGQDAVATAQAFLDGVGYDGVVLTKLDGDARGGAALSITQLTGRPIMFASAGEKLEDFDVFHPDRMASRILDMGDMLTLIEQAEKAFDEEQTAALADRLVSGEGFTLEDFVEQIQMVRKLGPIGNLLGMLPGAGRNKELLGQVNDKDLDRATAIVQSMTPEERRNPKIINGSRRARIAGGSGVTPGQVGALIQNFQEGQKQMRQLMGGGLGNIPGMPPGMRRAANKAVKGKKPKKKRPGGDPRRAAAKAAGNGGTTENAAPGNGRAAGCPAGCRTVSPRRIWPRGSPACRRAACPAGWGASPASASPTATFPPLSAPRATTSAARRSNQPPGSRPSPAQLSRRGGKSAVLRTSRPGAGAPSVPRWPELFRLGGSDAVDGVGLGRRLVQPVPQHAGEPQCRPPGHLAVTSFRLVLLPRRRRSRRRSAGALREILTWRCSAPRHASSPPRSPTTGSSPTSCSRSRRGGLTVAGADDVADTGKTLELVRKEIAEHVAEARTAVLYHKPWSIIAPEYVWSHTDRWINFPWSCQDPVVTVANRDA